MEWLPPPYRDRQTEEEHLFVQHQYELPHLRYDLPPSLVGVIQLVRPRAVEPICATWMPGP